MIKFRPLVSRNSCNSDIIEGGNIRPAVKKCFKVTTIIVLLVIVWGVFAILILLYHLPISRQNDRESSNVTLTGNKSYSSVTYDGSQFSGGGVLGPMYTCHEDFYLDEETGTCKPECGKWEMFPHKVENVLQVLFIAATAIGAFAGILVVTLACFRRKKMLIFPSSLVVYITVTIVIAELLVVVGVVKPKEVFCSSKNLIESYSNPTTYCTVASVLFRYAYAQAAWWWFCHVAAIFWGIRFPFHARSFEKLGRKKYLHIAVIILGLLLPCGPTIAVVVKGKFVLDRFPPHVCALESTDSGFYTTVLPYAVFHAAGCTLGIGIFWLLIKERLRKKSIRKTMAPEVKILVILTYFVSVSILGLIATTINYRKFPEGRGVHELEPYFLCESTSVVPNRPCDRRVVKRFYLVQALYDTAYVLFALLPAVHLIFAVNVQDLKKRCCEKKPKNMMNSNGVKV